MSLSAAGFAQWSAPLHKRHRPEGTLLYQIIEEYWPSFQAGLDHHGKNLPHFVAKEFDEYLICGKLEHGFPCWSDTCSLRHSLSKNFLGSIEPPAKFFTLLATGGMIAFVSLENVPVTVHDLEPGAQPRWTGSLEGR